MALGLAIVVMVIGGALAALLFFVAFEENRVSDSAGRLTQALGVAEEGALEVLRTWDPRVYNAHDPYPLDSGVVPWTPSLHGTGTYGGRVYKLNGELYLVETTGRVAAAEQRIGILAHVRPAPSGVVAALAVGKGNRRSGSVLIDGDDRVPPGWDPCGPADSTRAGLVVGGPGPGGLSVGGFSYAQLASRATRTVAARSRVIIAPTVVDERCDETVATNWGNGSRPWEACGGYLPVVHAVGDITLAGGQGQGALLVDGDLLVQGDVQWWGLVVVQGDLRVTSGGLGDIAIFGGVLVGDSAIFDAGVAGSVAITYSKCAIVKALETVTPAVLLASRGWIGLAEEP